MADFKKLSDVETIFERGDDDSVLVVSNGDIKQMSVSKLASMDDLVTVEAVDAPGEDDSILLVSDGTVKQVSAAEFAAASGGSTAPIYLYAKGTGASSFDLVSNFQVAYSGILYENGVFEGIDFEEVPLNLYELFLAGTPIFVHHCNSSEVNTNMWFKILAASSDNSDDCFWAFDPVSSMYNCFYIPKGK